MTPLDVVVLLSGCYVAAATLLLVRGGGGPSEPARSADATVSCPACSAENLPNQRYCRGCRADLGGVVAEAW